MFEKGSKLALSTSRRRQSRLPLSGQGHHELSTQHPVLEYFEKLSDLRPQEWRMCVMDVLNLARKVCLK